MKPSLVGKEGLILKRKCYVTLSIKIHADRLYKAAVLGSVSNWIRPLNESKTVKYIKIGLLECQILYNAYWL